MEKSRAICYNATSLVCYREYRLSDPLAEIIAVMRPGPPLSKVVTGSGVWRVDRPAGGEPFYCVVVEGSARLSVRGGPAVTLEQGDFALIPASCGFTMSSLAAAAPDDEMQWTITVRDTETRHGNPQGPADVRLLIGHFVFGSPDSDLLVSLLPQFLHVRGDMRLSMLVRLITDEARGARPAREMILARLLEVLLVEAVRSTAADSGIASPGIARGLADPRLAEVIRGLHRDPARPWTVEEMARDAALSRSAFFNRFRRMVGLAPMEYLTSWRMALAKDMLEAGQAGMQEIADSIGYGSASAFSTAFTRLVGVPPSRYAERQKEVGEQPLVA